MKINKLIIFAFLAAFLTNCSSSQYIMKERNNAKMDLVKEDFTLSELVEGEAVSIKIFGITCAKYIPVALPKDTTKILDEAVETTAKTTKEVIKDEEEDEELETKLVIFDEVDSTYLTLSGDEFIDRHINKVKKQKAAKAKKVKVKKPKVKKQPSEEKIKIKIDFFSVPVIGSAVDTKAANYALYAMMLENEDNYEVVFYPQYEIKKSGFGFFYQKTRVKAKARLGKLID